MEENQNPGGLLNALGTFQMENIVSFDWTVFAGLVLLFILAVLFILLTR